MVRYFVETMQHVSIDLILLILLVIVQIHITDVYVNIVNQNSSMILMSIYSSLIFFCLDGLSLKLYLVNYTNETSPGLEVLISNINQTIINMTNGSVIATSITIR